MKKVNETPERLLIHIDNDLAMVNKETLKTIFEEVDKMKTILLSLDLSFTKETFVKCLNEGSCG